MAAKAGRPKNVDGELMIYGSDDKAAGVATKGGKMRAPNGDAPRKRVVRLNARR